MNIRQVTFEDEYTNSSHSVHSTICIAVLFNIIQDVDREANRILDETRGVACFPVWVSVGLLTEVG
ncbi:hypothetical protein [Nostoc sp. DSM 114160]